MTKPVLVLTSDAPWAEVVRQRVHSAYRPVVYGEQAGYVARLADDNAALILVDGDREDWRFWTTTPKTSPATRRIPVVLVSARPDVRADAMTAGADLALGPGELIEQLGTLLTDIARVPDPEVERRLGEQCAEPLPAEAIDAIHKFNAGEYYKQHDLFEALWMQETGPVRDLYRAVLQVGIAYFQITRGNFRGAHKMLLRSVQWLALLPDVCQGVNVARLKADAARVREELERLGPERIHEFDRALLKGVQLIGDEDR